MIQTRLELYQKVTPLAQLGIWERNLITGAIYWNSVIRSIYEVGEDFNPSLADSASFYLQPERVLDLVSQAQQAKGQYTIQLQLRASSGTIKWVKIRMEGRFKDNSCISIYGTLEDITGEVQLLRQLEEREQLFLQAFEYAPIGVALISPEGKWLRVNNSLCNFLGYTADEFLGHYSHNFTYPEDASFTLLKTTQLLKGEIDLSETEKRYVHKNGQPVWAFLSESLVRDLDEKPLYIIAHIKDISERRKHAEILLRERQRLDNILKSTRIGTWEWNIETDEVICNAQSLNLMGYDSNTPKMDLMRTWQDLIYPEDQQGNQIQLERCFSKKSKFYGHECRMRHKNGDWIWVECRGKVISWSETGEPLLMLGTYADIHDRKSMQEEQEKAMKIISEQNERLLNFTHIVSHNLRSHAGNIQMLVEVLKEETDAEEKNKLIQMLETNTSNLQQTLSHLNDVIKMNVKGEQYKNELNLLQEINKILNILSESIKSSDAVIHIEVDPLLNIHFVPAYLESVLLNLISNCITYRSPERQLQIQITASGQSPVWLKVADNGVGINLDLHGHKLFGMYKTFHGNEGARGIGLFIVKNQVMSMGGKISAGSEPGKGTVFTVEII